MELPVGVFCDSHLWNPCGETVFEPFYSNGQVVKCVGEVYFADVRSYVSKPLPLHEDDLSHT